MILLFHISYQVAGSLALDGAPTDDKDTQGIYGN